MTDHKGTVRSCTRPTEEEEAVGALLGVTLILYGTYRPHRTKHGECQLFMKLWTHKTQLSREARVLKALIQHPRKVRWTNVQVHENEKISKKKDLICSYENDGVVLRSIPSCSTEAGNGKRKLPHPSPPAATCHHCIFSWGCGVRRSQGDHWPQGLRCLITVWPLAAPPQSHPSGSILWISSFGAHNFCNTHTQTHTSC